MWASAVLASDCARKTHLKLKKKPSAERAMGSTPTGNAAPINRRGQVLPQHIEIDRDGWRRVRVTGRA
jgi:hypothetical protein